ncbi:Transposase IS116/IS110/IS902 family protein, partial [Clostridium sp. DSM 8431]
NLLNEINILIESSEFSESIKKNIELIDSIPGIGRLTAITLIAEIGDINGFIKPKHLVAFFGIDSSVNQSGKFQGNQCKISKRGTRIGEELYIQQHLLLLDVLVMELLLMAFY